MNYRQLCLKLIRQMKIDRQAYKQILSDWLRSYNFERFLHEKYEKELKVMKMALKNIVCHGASERDRKEAADALQRKGKYERENINKQCQKNAEKAVKEGRLPNIPMSFPKGVPMTDDEMMREYVPTLALWFSKAYGFGYDPLTELDGPKNLEELLNNKTGDHYKIMKGSRDPGGSTIVMEVTFKIQHPKERETG